jgi:hypothetical protein
MKKSETSGSVLIPHDLDATPNTIVVKFVSIETPPLAASSPTMTLKEFKAAFGSKPGATFHCPEHLKHELED